MLKEIFEFKITDLWSGLHVGWFWVIFIILVFYLNK